MSYARSRLSPPPPREKNENGDKAPKSRWYREPKDIGGGVPASELWGVAQRDLSKPRRHRGAKACARQRAKQAARRKGVPLKAYLKSVQEKKR